jgi:hypothetical protein
MNTPISDITTSPRMNNNSIANISLYIPRVFKNITGKRISAIFHSLRIGQVRSVNFIPKVGKQGHYNSVSIHFDYWYDNVAARNFQEKVITNKEARVVYDDPWFWIVQEFKPEPASATAQKVATAPCKGCEYIAQLEQHNLELQGKIYALEDELASVYYNNERCGR